MAGGRPKKYKPEFVNVARMMAKVGATHDEIAEALSVNRATFYRWMSEFREFCDAVKLGKKAADDRVERALYNRAVGMTRKVDRVVSFQGSHEIVETKEELAPDTTAARFWLTNRKAKYWQNMPEIGDGAEAVPLAIVIRRKDASEGSADEGSDV